MTERKKDRRYEASMKEEKKKMAQYIYHVMKQTKPQGPTGIMAAYHFG